MEEDDYYLDHYDCLPSSVRSNVPDTNSPSPESVDGTSKSTRDNAASEVVRTDDVDVEFEGVDYEDDYDHVYMDTAGAEEYLREIWTQLGVGHNGYLNLAELYRVCEHIGMSASEEMIEQLFDKLDNDQDGRVSFVEFVDGLFKYVHKAQTPRSPSGANGLDSSPSTTNSPSSNSFDNQHSPQHYIHHAQHINSTVSQSCAVFGPDSEQSFTDIPQHSQVEGRNVSTTASNYPSVQCSNHSRASFGSSVKVSPNTDCASSSSPSSSHPSVSSSVNGNEPQVQSNHSSSVRCSSPSPRHHGSPTSSPSHRIASLHLLSNYTDFLTIPTDKDGYTESRKVINLWESFGITNGKQLLKNLGFASKQYINVFELWSQMEDRLYQACDNELYQISLATFLNEFLQLKSNYEHVCGKCDRLETNLCEANARAEFLAQEVDEQHCRMEKSAEANLMLMEKKYQEQIRLMEKEFSKEKELMIVQSCHIRQNIEKRMNSVQEQMDKLRQNAFTLEEENKRLENDYRKMMAQNIELQQSCLKMERQVNESNHLHAKIVELESIGCLVDNQQYQEMVKEIDRLKYQNKSLQDQNDELLIEKESLRQQLASRHLHSRDQHQALAAGSENASNETTAVNQSMMGSKCAKKRRRKKKKIKQTKPTYQQQQQSPLRKVDPSSLPATPAENVELMSAKMFYPHHQKHKQHQFEDSGHDEIDDNMSTVSTATCATMEDTTNMPTGQQNTVDRIDATANVQFGHGHKTIDDDKLHKRDKPNFCFQAQTHAQTDEPIEDECPFDLDSFEKFSLQKLTLVEKNSAQQNLRGDGGTSICSTLYDEIDFGYSNFIDDARELYVNGPARNGFDTGVYQPVIEGRIERSLQLIVSKLIKDCFKYQTSSQEVSGERCTIVSSINQSANVKSFVQQLEGCVDSGVLDNSQTTSSTSEQLHDALDKIKDGLLMAIAVSSSKLCPESPSTVKCMSIDQELNHCRMELFNICNKENQSAPKQIMPNRAKCLDSPSQTQLTGQDGQVEHNRRSNVRRRKGTFDHNNNPPTSLVNSRI